MSDVYYDPEKFGLTILGEAEASGGYEYDKIVVWRDQHGQLFTGTDSGCSCGSPFETTGLGDLDKVDFHQAMKALDDWASDHAGYYGEHVQQEVSGLREKLLALTP